MTSHIPAWVLVLIFAILQLLLTVVLFAIATHETLMFGKVSLPVLLLFWVLALPLAVADRCGFPLPLIWYLPNSLLYGIIMWAVWRAFRPRS